MLHLTYAAGLRVSELIGLMYAHLARPHLDTVRVTGKGRRERVLPLWQETRSALRGWLSVRPDTGQDHLFLNARGKPMTRHGFAHRLELHATTARQRMPSMNGKRIFPHVLRHSCAAHTLEVRIPDQIDHRFRSKSITDSDPNRSLIPTEIDHRRRSKSIACHRS